MPVGLKPLYDDCMILNGQPVQVEIPMLCRKPKSMPTQLSHSEMIFDDFWHIFFGVLLFEFFNFLTHEITHCLLCMKLTEGK